MPHGEVESVGKGAKRLAMFIVVLSVLPEETALSLRWKRPRLGRIRGNGFSLYTSLVLFQKY